MAPCAPPALPAGRTCGGRTPSRGRARAALQGTCVLVCFCRQTSYEHLYSFSGPYNNSCVARRAPSCGEPAATRRRGIGADGGRRCGRRLSWCGVLALLKLSLFRCGVCAPDTPEEGSLTDVRRSYRGRHTRRTRTKRGHPGSHVTTWRRVVVTWLPGVRRPRVPRLVGRRTEPGAEQGTLRACAPAAGGAAGHPMAELGRHPLPTTCRPPATPSTESPGVLRRSPPRTSTAVNPGRAARPPTRTPRRLPRSRRRKAGRSARLVRAAARNGAVGSGARFGS